MKRVWCMCVHVCVALLGLFLSLSAVAAPLEAEQKLCPDLLKELVKDAEARGLQFAGPREQEGTFMWFWMDEPNGQFEAAVFVPAEQFTESVSNPAMTDLGICSIPSSPKKMRALKVRAPIPQEEQRPSNSGPT